MSEIYLSGDRKLRVFFRFSFKCEKEIGEIKFERSNLKGVDKRALEALPNVAKFSFADNSIEKLSPGACVCA